MKKLFYTIVFTFIIISNVSPCTNFLVTKGASTDGSTMITYSADWHLLYGELYHWPAAEYNKKDSLDIYEWDTGEYLGKIKQAKSTYQVVGNMNEHQLAIAETTFGGHKELVDTTGIIDYGSLIYITLQRAKTAREAIQLIDELTSEYGYYSSGESFSIADANEVWIMELIGKGTGNKGIVWVALKIPDGYISGHANQSRITTFPLNDKENCMFSSDVINFAREKGYFEGKDKDFSFSDAYAPVDFGGARFCEARVWSGFNKVSPYMDKYLDYAMGKNLENRMPLWIKPEKKLSVKDVFGLMRDYYQNSPMDMTKDIGSGPYKSIIRWRPLVWEIDSAQYFNERAISTQQTGFSFISQSRDWLPSPIGGILWFGLDDTYSTVYNPIYCGTTNVPPAFAEGNGSLMEFSDSSAFWIFNQVSNFAYTRYDSMIVDIQKVQARLEDSYLEKSKEIDDKATKLYETSPEAAIELVTNFSVATGINTFNEWRKLYHFLFTKYMDGNIKTPKAGQRDPHLEQPGYGQEWYRMLIKSTGNKFKYPEGNLH